MAEPISNRTPTTRSTFDPAAPPTTTSAPAGAGAPQDRVDLDHHDDGPFTTHVAGASVDSKTMYARSQAVNGALSAGVKGAEHAVPRTTHGMHLTEKGTDLGSIALHGAEAFGAHIGHGGLAVAGSIGMTVGGAALGFVALAVGLDAAHQDGKINGSRYQYADGFSAGVAAVLDPQYHPPEGKADSAYAKGLEEGRKWAARQSPETIANLKEGLAMRYHAQVDYHTGPLDGDNYRDALRTDLYRKVDKD